MNGRVLRFGDELAARILMAATRAYPNECCGLIEGVDSEDGWRAVEVHETANVAPDPTRRFLIDPQAQFDLLHALRGTGRRVIGCFHSHPDGAAKPSATDRADAYEAGFLYLIAGGAPDAGFTLGAFLFGGDEGFSPVALSQ